MTPTVTTTATQTPTVTATPSATPSTAEAGDVVINEILQNPAAVADTAGEWFEVYNAASHAIDLNGWTIADAGTDRHRIQTPNGEPCGCRPAATSCWAAMPTPAPMAVC